MADLSATFPMPTISTATPFPYFENRAGTIHADPQGFVFIRYAAGKRWGTSLAILLTHAGTLLRAKGWQGVLSDQRLMTPYSPAEEAWAQAYWNSQQAGRFATIYFAVVTKTP